MAKDNEQITEEVIEEAPVEKKEEVIVDEKPTEEVVEEKPTEEVVEEEKPNEFNAEAFSDRPVEKTEEELKEEVAEVEDEVVAEEEDDGTFKWADYSEDEEVVVEEEKPAEVVEDKKKEDEVVVEEKPTDFKAVADALGLKFETIEEFKEHLVNVEAENKKIKSEYSGGATNEKIDALKKLNANDDKELVRLSLEKEGFEGDELTNAVDKFIDNGMLEIEAKRIRNTVNKAIEAEQGNITQSTLEADATQQREYEESVKNLGEHISKTKTMFGFEMAKDEESLAKVQKGHFNYIKSGKFMDDVFKDDASLTEAAWLWKNKDTILKAIANKNLQQGKETILNDIKNPEVEKPQRFKAPDGSNEFDPKKFTFGEAKKK
jgi:hypothetical protein